MNIFIDGSAGTTGLQIEERLSRMPGITLLTLSEDKRKDLEARKEMINSADAVFLCLPDDAAREAVKMAENPNVIIIDASTAHRTLPDWAYGFPELSPEHERRVRESNRIAVPGCHASGFAALVYPLVQSGLLAVTAGVSCFSLTGYSGGGKAMIAEYERLHSEHTRAQNTRPYALELMHKHLPEMQKICGLAAPPVFQPNLVDVYSGMLVSVPLHMDAGKAHEVLSGHYSRPGNVHVMPLGGGEMLESGRLDMEKMNGTDEMEIFVFGHDRQTLLISRFDNLGKGASGAAVQCLKLRFNLPEETV